jgi:signal transduction histidine kinase
MYASVAGLAAIAVWLELFFDAARPEMRLVPFACVVGLAAWTYRMGVRDRTARLIAERAARQSDRIADLTAALGRVHLAAPVIRTALGELLYAMRADAGMILLVNADRTAATVAHAVGYSDAGHADEMSLVIRSPIGDALAVGAPIILESSQQWRAEYPDVPDHVRLQDYSTTAVVPLVFGNDVIAIARLDLIAARSLTAHDREYLDVFGRSVAQALDRAWHYESAQTARQQAESLRERADQELLERQRTEMALRASETKYRALAIRTTRMHELTAALSEAVTMDAVANAVVQHGGVLIGAADGGVKLLAHNSLGAGLCATEAVETGRPVFVPSWTDAPEPFWRSASLAAGAGYLSSAALPLLVDGEALGALEFHFSVPVLFDAEYQALLMSVAHHCSQALDRARLYESAQRARTEAETANRLKDDFLSIVSHELRTPLNAVLGWASMLRQRKDSPELAARAVQSIFDNATRQTRLIDDLLDISRMVLGQVTLDVQDINLLTLVAGVVESVAPAAASSRVSVAIVDVPPAVIRGDRRRLEQVFFNLLGNALKFTPPGGQVTIDAECVDHAVEVHVRDTGIGIEPEFLPYIFERFRQRDSSPTRSHGGLGLGLSIAKQLVEAHAGRIVAESAGHGQGTTFSVCLPLAESAALGQYRGMRDRLDRSSSPA